MRNYVLRELLKRAPEFAPQLIFDVGANIGQSVAEFRDAYPDSMIMAFEPVPDAFSELQRVVEGDQRVQTFNYGLSRTAGELTMTANGSSTGNRVVDARGRTEGTISVPMMSGDQVCAEHDIDHLDFLKIDAEGHDVEVLAGFSTMLRDQHIEYVQVEVSLSPRNLVHASFAQVSGYMTSFDYGLLGLYGLKRRMPRLGTRRGALFGDAVFVRDEVVA